MKTYCFITSSVDVFSKLFKPVNQVNHIKQKGTVMRIPGLIAILVATCMVSPVYADITTHTGVVRSIKGGEVVIALRGGQEKTLELDQGTIFYLNGQEVPFKRVAPGSRVRVDCPAGKACIRLIVDTAPQ